MRSSVSPVASRLLLRWAGLTAIDAKTKANIATELRDSIEGLCSGSNYAKFLAKLWPVFKKILQGEPVFNNESPDHV